jgi:hypothetical protein
LLAPPGQADRALDYKLEISWFEKLLVPVGLDLLRATYLLIVAKSLKGLQALLVCQRD